MGVRVKKYRGAWWSFVHHRGRRWKRRVGKSKRAADEVARQIEARLVLGDLGAEPPEHKPTPFDSLAEQWISSEVEDAGGGDRSQVRPGTAHRYRIQVRVHLIPFFRSADVKAIDPAEVQRFYQHCLRRRRPASPKAIDMALTVLRLILAYARKLGLVEFNAVTEWRSGRRRGVGSNRMPSDKVLSAEEIQHLLNIAVLRQPRYFPFTLFLADTGCRIGEAVALQWRDVDLHSRTARIRRSLSSGVHLGPTKTGQERVVELSSRLAEVLHPTGTPASSALVFPNARGGYIHASPFRTRIWKPLVEEALGQARRFTPHGLRHTRASLHMARGTPLKWIQAQGGWTTAKLLLDVYGHFLPSEYTGYSDALSRGSDAPYTHPEHRSSADSQGDGAASAAASTGFRLPAVEDDPEIPDHAQEPQPEAGASSGTGDEVGPGKTDSGQRAKPIGSRDDERQVKKRL